MDNGMAKWKWKPHNARRASWTGGTAALAWTKGDPSDCGAWFVFDLWAKIKKKQKLLQVTKCTTQTNEYSMRSQLGNLWNALQGKRTWRNLRELLKGNTIIMISLTTQEIFTCSSSRFYMQSLTSSSFHSVLQLPMYCSIYSLLILKFLNLYSSLSHNLSFILSLYKVYFPYLI